MKIFDLISVGINVGFIVGFTVGVIVGIGVGLTQNGSVSVKSLTNDVASIEFNSSIEKVSSGLDTKHLIYGVTKQKMLKFGSKSQFLNHIHVFFLNFLFCI